MSPCRCFSVPGALLAATLLCAISMADSTVMNYQGALRNSAGTPIADGAYNMVFSIYDSLAGGNQVWTESHSGVVTRNGLFSVNLGETTALGTMFSTHSALYLEITTTTGAGTETYAPRFPLTSAPFAKKATQAARLGGMTPAELAAQMDTKDTAAIGVHNTGASAHTDIRDAIAVKTPPGTVYQFAGAGAPAGWLVCDGSLVSRSAYAALFSRIGTTYGAGDGSSTFALPNMTNRVAVGKGGAPFTAVGAIGGEISHTVTTGELPSHTHIQDAHNHVIRNGLNNPYGLSASSGGGADDNNWCFTDVPKASAGFGAFVANYATATNQDTGGGGAYNILQPYLVLNYIIKY